jgi:hypothetical protein
MIDSTIKAPAVALLKSGEMRVAEVADLTGQSQLVATWCPGALEARREWCRQRWKDAAKGVGNAVALRLAVISIGPCLHSLPSAIKNWIAASRYHKFA